MRSVQPEVFLVAQPAIDYDQLAAYLREVGGEQWLERLDRGELASGEQASDAQNLAEFAGKMCYRAWEPGLNPNVRRVRNDHEAYLQNILKQQHGSVLEHASFTFVLHNVSRVMTHEVVRHRPGTAVSQESLRFVRLDEIPFWFPDWAREDPELMKRATALLDQMEEFQRWMAQHFGLDEEGVPFHEKKKRKTSFPMRRNAFAPDGGGEDRHRLDGEHPDPAAHDRGPDRLIRGGGGDPPGSFGKIGEIMPGRRRPPSFGGLRRGPGTGPGCRKWRPRSGVSGSVCASGIRCRRETARSGVAAWPARRSNVRIRQYDVAQLDARWASTRRVARTMAGGPLTNASLSCQLWPGGRPAPQRSSTPSTLTIDPRAWPLEQHGVTHPVSWTRFVLTCPPGMARICRSSVPPARGALAMEYFRQTRGHAGPAHSGTGRAGRQTAGWAGR